MWSPNPPLSLFSHTAALGAASSYFIDTSQAGYLPSFTAMSYPLMRSSPRAFQVTRLVAP